MPSSGGGIITLPLKSKNYSKGIAEGRAGERANSDGNAAMNMLNSVVQGIKTGIQMATNNNLHEFADAKEKSVSGTISFKVNFSFPVWEHAVPRVLKSFRRLVSIVCGRHLPDVNGSPPSCKVVILFNNIIVAKSMVIPNSSFPVWPETSCEIDVSYDSIAVVVVQVREACVSSFSYNVNIYCTCVCVGACVYRRLFTWIWTREEMFC